jgi:EAL domain-containing protein (putative c-di-GMP-specific phosphodiesterase class I)
MSALKTGLPRVRPVYQPIVDLDTGEVVAYEALARGPAGSDLEFPAALFGHARDHGLEGALDVECRAAAMRGALEARLPASVPLFVNAEPRWLGRPWPEHLAGIAETARRRLQVVVEITERALVADPAGLFAEVRRLREAGYGVALDDVGAVPDSLALMPFIDPDVIKLDLRLVQEHTRADVSGIVNAVAAQAEWSHATVLAEGIETEEHRQRALAAGATLGQGWLLGRPAPLPEAVRPPLVAGRSFTRPAPSSARTPFDVVRDHRTVRVVTKDLLLPVSHHLERHALRTTVSPVLLSAFEDDRHFTPGTAERYEKLARRCSFVGALGAGMGPVPVPGVRGARIPEDDPLRGEWVVCAVGPHFAGMLAAKDLGDDGPDRERRFEMVITHDRDLVVAAARTLLARIGPAAV